MKPHLPELPPPPVASDQVEPVNPSDCAMTDQKCLPQDRSVAGAAPKHLSNDENFTGGPGPLQRLVSLAPLVAANALD
jgi:hypothetical protein